MKKASRRRPSFDALEDRGLLTVTGLPWPDPGHLTLSLAPDGTPAAGTPSSLYAALDAKYPTTVWQAQVLRAFQSWAVLGDINIGLVADAGTPLGQPRPLQGDASVGDLRVAARPLSANVAGIGTPFDALGGGWSGDVLLNTLAPFGDGSNGTEDLFSVLLHEAGHAFGLDHSGDPASAMYEQNVGGHTGPDAADAAALQALYGPRHADPYEGARGNETASTATPLAFVATPLDLVSLYAPNPGAAAAVADGDLAGSGDADVYSVTVPSGASGSFAVNLRASGVSLVTARVTVLDPLGQLVGSASTTDPTHNDLTVTVPAVPGARYFVRVESSQPGVFGVGSYRLAAGVSWLTQAAVNAPPLSTLPTGGDTFARASDIKPSAPGTDARWAYDVRGVLTRSGDASYYRVTTGATAQPALLASVWGLSASGLAPRVVVFDAAGRPVPADLLSQDGSAMTVQVLGPAANATYVLKVSAQDPSTSAHSTGRFALAANTAAAPVRLSAAASGTLSAARTQDFRTLTVSATGVVHLDLSLDGGAADGTAVKVTLYDSRNQAVYSIRALTGAGGRASGDVLLGPGVYTVRVVAAAKSGQALTALAYTLRGLVRSDPIGPNPDDPTLTHSPGSGGPADPGWDQNPYWYYAYVATLTDPGSNPWLY